MSHPTKLTVFLLILVAASLLSTPGATADQTATPSGPSHTPEHYLQRVDEMITAAEEMRTYIDRSVFDLEALLESTDYEVDRIIGFVKEEIGFEQYPGTLRGAEGTLMSRAGNSLDQSVLLARLLRDAGVDARIARAQLSEAQARELLQEMRRARSRYPSIGSPQGITSCMFDMGLFEKSREEKVAELEKLLASQSPTGDSRAVQQVRSTLDDVSRRLSDAGIALGDEAHLASLIAEAEDYFWVQYREDASGAWTNVHPSFRQETQFEPVFTTVYSESIPEELQHRFRYQVFIERAINGRLEVAALSQPWERPTANLSAVPLVFTNAPDTLMGGASLRDNVDDALDRATFFAPSLGTTLTEGAKFFDSTGTLIDPEVASAPGAGLFKTIGGLFGEALGEMGGEGTPKLTAQWLQFTFVAPDGSERSYQRMIMDRIGADARRRGEVPASLGPTTKEDLRPLLQRHSFMVATGMVPRARALDFALQQVVDSRPLYQAIITATPGAKQGDIPKKIRDVPVGWAGHLHLFNVFDRVTNFGPDGRLFRSGPTLVIQSEGLSPRPGYLMKSIDIVQNPWRGFRWEGNELRLDTRAAATAGIWETGSEGFAIDASSDRFNTQVAFSRAEASGAKVHVFKPGSRVEAAQLSPDSLASIQQDVDRGFAVIFPDLEQPEGAGWWRINPQTGETLGQIGTGRGSEVTEWVSLTSFGLSVATALVNELGCMSAHGAAMSTGSYGGFACCSLMNALSFAIGDVAGELFFAAGAAWEVAGASGLLDAPCGVLDN
jgi:hypothetical protein